MSNEETLQEYNTRLEENNVSLANVLETINNLPTSSGGSSTDVYSTEEVKTNKVWIDGKPIYRKVFNSSDALTGGTNTIQHNIGSFGNVVDVKLFVKFHENFYLTQYPKTTEYIGVNIVNPTNFSIIVGSNWANSFKYGYIVILEYTKTTD